MKHGASPELKGRPRRRLLAQVRREEPNCWLCGYPIDVTLPQTDRWSSTVDEVVPRSLSLDPRRAALDRANCRHAHRVCNSRRGITLAQSQRQSRAW